MPAVGSSETWELVNRSVRTPLVRPSGPPGRRGFAANERARPLSRPEFVRIAENGFGDGWNACAHSMAWFGGHLFVGTSRATLGMVRVNTMPPAMEPWPIVTPDNLYELDRRAEIWRYDPTSRAWQRVYLSPIVEEDASSTVPRDIGYRGMGAFAVGGLECLYVCTWSPSRGLPPRLLRSPDGRHFEELPGPDWGTEGVNTYRVLVQHGDRLFTAPTGTTEGYGRASEAASGIPVVFSAGDPAGHWEAVSSPGFGDAMNQSVFEILPFAGHLYATTVNPSGFQVWKTSSEGTPPYQWTNVVTDGASRGALNEVGVSMAEFRGKLYVGTGVLNGGHDRRRDIGPAAPEIIRIDPDDSWELVMGSPRETPTGRVHPLSGLGPGFDNPFCGYVWRLTQHDGVLYAGTYDWSVLLPYLSQRKWPVGLRAEMQHADPVSVARAIGGCELWRSDDGVTWLPVTKNGFDNRFNWGVRTMASTPAGLFVGTANPFGPEVAEPQDGGWEYHENPKGGLEVWLGAPDLSSRGVRAKHGRPRESVAARASATPATPRGIATGRGHLVPIPPAVLILAPPRSFTSVVSGMLGQHPELYGLPELHLFVAQHVYELVSLYRVAGPRRRDGLLRAVAELVVGEQSVRGVEVAKLWLARRMRESTDAVFRELAARVAPRAVVEKSVSTSWKMPFLERARRSLPEARYVHLTRHPRRQCESLLEALESERQLRRFAMDMQTDPPTLDPQILWLQIHRNILRFLSDLPEDTHIRVRGEDLLADKDNHFRGIAGWLNLRTDDGAIDAMRHAERSPFARVGPVNAPFGHDPKFLGRPEPRTTAPVHVSLEGPLPWRRDGAGFVPEVVEMAQAFGYE